MDLPNFYIFILALLVFLSTFPLIILQHQNSMYELAIQEFATVKEATIHATIPYIINESCKNLYKLNELKRDYRCDVSLNTNGSNYWVFCISNGISRKNILIRC